VETLQGGFDVAAIHELLPRLRANPFEQLPGLFINLDILVDRVDPVDERNRGWPTNLRKLMYSNYHAWIDSSFNKISIQRFYSMRSELRNNPLSFIISHHH
jgi:hypothetical protein